MTVRLFVPAADAAHPTVAYHSDLGHPVVEVTAGQGAPWLQFDDPEDVATWIAVLCDARELLVNSGVLHMIDLVPSLAPVGDGPAAQGITGAGAADESPAPVTDPGAGDDLPPLPQRGELHDCPPCALSNCEECWARPERGTEARDCLCDNEGHTLVGRGAAPTVVLGEQDEVTE